MGLGVPPTPDGDAEPEAHGQAVESRHPPDGSATVGSPASSASKMYVSGNYEEKPTNNVQKLADWHRMIADHMLLNPAMKAKDRAEYFGVSQPWFSTLTRTDAFRAYFADRLREHQQMVSESVIAAAGDVAKKGLQRMKEKLDQAIVSDTKMSDLVSATELAGKMIGLGHAQRAGDGAQVTVNIGNGVDPAMLAAARQKMIEVGHHNSDTREESLAGAIATDTTEEPELIEWEDVDDATNPA